MGMKFKPKIIYIDHPGIFAPKNGTGDFAGSFLGYRTDGDQIEVFFSFCNSSFSNFYAPFPGHDFGIDGINCIFDHRSQQSFDDGRPYR